MGLCSVLAQLCSSGAKFAFGSDQERDVQGMAQSWGSAAPALLTVQGFSNPHFPPSRLLRALPIVCVTPAVSTDITVHLKEPPKHRLPPQLCQATQSPLTHFQEMPLPLEH